MRLPHRVIYKKDLTSEGSSKYFNIYIKSGYEEDEGLLEHEYTHIKQWYLGLLIGLSLSALIYFLGFVNTSIIVAILSINLQGVAYTCSRTIRLWSEIFAYRKQLEYGREHLDFYADELYTRYNLQKIITKEEAINLLENNK